VVDQVNESLDVFDNYALKYAKVAALIGPRAQHWPRTKTGKLVLDKDTLWKMGQVYSDIKMLGETKATLSALQKLDLPIGTDNRNRFGVRPFTAKTGRNAPETSKFIFGQAVWFRSMVAPRLVTPWCMPIGRRKNFSWLGICQEMRKCSRITEAVPRIFQRLFAGV
jgi:hypothetical protein